MLAAARICTALQGTACLRRSPAAWPCSPAAAVAPQPLLPPLPRQQRQQRAVHGRSSSTTTELSHLEQIMEQGRLTTVAQSLWAQVLRRGDVVVDATAGNGKDSAFLAAAVGRSGTVHAFDVQQAAIDATRARLADSIAAPDLPALHLHLQSHAELGQHVADGSAALVVFNLGFLPGSDKQTTTQPGSTQAAVRAACAALQRGGLCSLLCYTGHPGGVEEYETVRALAAGLPTREWITSEVQLLNRPTAPVLVLLWKRA